jgi:hypothetical protein
MVDNLCFNNYLSFLKSVTSLIFAVAFFLLIAIVRNKEDHSEESFSSWRVHQSFNFLVLLQFLFHWFRNSVCTRMNWFASRIHQLETNWFNNACWILLMFHQIDFHILGVISWFDAVPLHGGSQMSWWHHLSLQILAYIQYQEFSYPENIHLFALINIKKRLCWWYIAASLSFIGIASVSQVPSGHLRSWLCLVF